MVAMDPPIRSVAAWVWLASCVLPMLAASCATAGFPVGFSEKPSARFVPSQDPYFGPPEAAIRRLLLFNRKNGAANHFCVIGYRWADGNVQVWAHWKEDERLLLWRGNSDPEMREKGLVYAQRNLKLGQDTVESANDLQGSTYRETRAWWESLAKDCDAHGERHVIRPFPGG